MRIDSELFSQGGVFSCRGASTSDVLAHHERKVFDKIKNISDIQVLDDNFLRVLVKETLVEPLHIDFSARTRTQRTEQFSYAELPCSRIWGRDSYESSKTYPKTVVCISIPFTGDPELLQHCPSSDNLSRPRGQVSGKKIEFDVVLWGNSGHTDPTKEIEENQNQIKWYADNVNKDVKKFNDELAIKVTKVFEGKLTTLQQEKALLDATGIPEAIPEINELKEYQPFIPRTKKREPQVVVQQIQAMYVEQLTQVNYNSGDVNNEIQSNEQ